MRRAKHADKRLLTRKRLELGEAVEAAGAAHLTRDDIITALCQFMSQDKANVLASPYDDLAEKSELESQRQLS